MNREKDMPLTPSLLIATASAFIGVKEQGGANRGEMVDRFLASAKLGPGYPWCAAFVSYVGYWSHYDHHKVKSVWPVPRTASCWELGQFAKATRILEKEPLEGDIFLIHNAALKRFAHTGVVIRVLAPERRTNGDVWHHCITIEGNTNEEGSREGEIVARKTRTFYPHLGDRFIRWVALDRRDEAGKADAGRDATTKPDIGTDAAA